MMRMRGELRRRRSQGCVAQLRPAPASSSLPPKSDLWFTSLSFPEPHSDPCSATSGGTHNQAHNTSRVGHGQAQLGSDADQGRTGPGAVHQAQPAPAPAPGQDARFVRTGFRARRRRRLRPGCGTAREGVPRRRTGQGAVAGRGMEEGSEEEGSGDAKGRMQVRLSMDSACRAVSHAEGVSSAASMT